MNDPGARSRRTQLKEYALFAPRLVRLVARLMRDPRVPPRQKAILVVLGAYLASPIDVIPDFIPVLGQLDDLILVPLGVALAVRLIPPEVLEDNRRRAEAAAEVPSDWRIGVLILAIWAIALAFVLRWTIAFVTG